MSAPGSAKWAILSVAPFAIFVIVFAAYPMVEMIRMSVSAVDIVDGQFAITPTGLGNFREVFLDADAWHSMRVNAVFVAASVVVSLVLGIALAFVVDRSSIMHHIARNVLIWPAVVTPVVVSLVWLLVISPTAGGLNKFLEYFGLPGQSWLNSESGALASAIGVDVWHWTPIVFLFTYTALTNIDREVVQAARVDGASEWQVRRLIMLPMIRGTLIGLLLVRVVQGVKAFDEIYLLTQGGPNGATELISLYIRTVFFDRLEYGYASALSLTVVIITVAIVGISVGVRQLRKKGAR